MSETTVLFVCPDNAFLSPLAEAYLNSKGKGLVRAFSAGLVPGHQLHPEVDSLLRTCDLSAEGLVPKSLDIFLMPHAPVPDRVISLMPVPRQLFHEPWRGIVPIDVWDVPSDAAASGLRDDSADCFGRIRALIDRALDPSPTEEFKLVHRQVA